MSSPDTLQLEGGLDESRLEHQVKAGTAAALACLCRPDLAGQTHFHIQTAQAAPAAVCSVHIHTGKSCTPCNRIRHRSHYIALPREGVVEEAYVCDLSVDYILATMHRVICHVLVALHICTHDYLPVDSEMLDCKTQVFDREALEVVLYRMSYEWGCQGVYMRSLHDALLRECFKLL